MQITFLLSALLTGVLTTSAVSDTPPDAARYRGWTVSAVELPGVPETLVSDLRKGLALSGQFKIYKTQKARFYEKLFSADLDRIRLYLARRGYPYAVVTPVLKPRETGRSLVVVFAVEPGPAVRLAGVEVRGAPAGVVDLTHAVSTTDSGTVFTDETANRLADMLRSGIANAGYARASVTSSVDWPESTAVLLTLDVDAGNVYYFRDVEVNGAPDDLVPLTLKTIDIRSGERFRPSYLQEARINLRLLDLFRQIRVSTRESGDDSLTVVADLVERKQRTIEAGGGYWSDERVRFRTRWEHRNLFSGGRGASAALSLSQFVQDAAVSTWWPALLGVGTRVTLRTSAERQNEESYETITAGGSLILGYRRSARTSANLSLSVSGVDVSVTTRDAGAFVTGGGLLTVLSGRIVTDTTDDRVTPTSGWYASLYGELAPPGALSNSHFVLGEVALTRYLSLAEGVVSVGRIDLGLGEPISPSVDLLPSKRFYAGGSTSMRGFRRRKLGPLDDAGAPLGGEAKLVASVELRVPLVWRFRAAGFVDTGQVWRRRGDVDLSDLEVAAGPAVMLMTPVGPIRADWGFRLTHLQKSEPDWVFHILIGNPF